MRNSNEITAERIARLHELRLTKYTPDQIDEITGALAALDQAEAEYEAATNAAWAIIQPYDTGFIGWQCYLEGAIADLYMAMNDTDRVTFDRGGHGNESFPVSLWKKSAGQFARQTRRIRQAIQGATASAVA